jgi:hypothetical protein
MNFHINESRGQLLDRAIRDAGFIGRTWATHGLTVGKSALENSASTLHKAASFLGELSHRIGEERPSVETKDETVVEAESSASSNPADTTTAPS